MRWGTAVLVAVLVVALAPVEGRAQPACAIAPEFEPLRNAVGPEIVGECAGSLTESPAEGLTQATTRGLLKRRISDGVILFADEATTWLDGPEGLQSRANGDRFAWEPPLDAGPAASVAQASAAQASAAQASAAQASAPPMSAAPAAPISPAEQPTPGTKLTPALERQCIDIVGSTPDRGGPTRDQQVGICQQLGEELGKPGVDCYAQATKRTASLIGRIRTQTHNDLFNAELDVCKASIR